MRPECPSCKASIPLRESATTSAKRPLSPTCTSCNAPLPAFALPGTPNAEPARKTRREHIWHKLTGE